MSGRNLDIFHLAYVPATALPTEAVSESKGDDELCQAPLHLGIMKASSIHLYRCRDVHGANEQYDFEENIQDGVKQTEPFDQCDCCCCHAKQSSRHIIQQFSGDDRNARGASTDRLEGRLFLAVLVPPCLTEQYTTLASSYDSPRQTNSRLQNACNLDEKPSTQVGVDQNPGKLCRISDLLSDIDNAEMDLLKSIHPSLYHENTSDFFLEGENKTTDLAESESENNQKESCNNSTNSNSLVLRVCGVITSETQSPITRLPADMLLLEPCIAVSPYARHSTSSGKNSSYQYLALISHHLNHDTSSSAPWAVLKAFLVNSLSIHPNSSDNSSISNIIVHNSFCKNASLPCCPVCLNRIEPRHLGLPELDAQHKCSQRCGSAVIEHSKSYASCVNESIFAPWPTPSYCAACHVIFEKQAYSEELQSNVTQSTTISTSSKSTPGQVENSAHENCNGISSSLLPFQNPKPSEQLTCHRCGITNTLWVCLSCGVVGCGRYTLKHAEEHFTLTGHPYSLELATMRIWDYETGRFAHRRDLVECPVLSVKWGGLLPLGDQPQGLSQGLRSPTALTASSTASGSLLRGESTSFSDNDNDSSWRKCIEDNRQYDRTSLQHHGSSHVLGESTSCHSIVSSAASSSAAKHSSPPPKKGMMISQEYEALLQSALEEQSQHFEGEISRLRAELASSRMERNQRISERESREIQSLRADSDRLRQEVERLTSSLLEAQTEDTRYRAVSQKLLREQSIAKELLEKLRKETRQVHESRSQQMEELELQIADLSANLRMRSQIARNEELSQAQIFGTTGGGDKGGKSQRGKKSRRHLRRKNND